MLIKLPIDVLTKYARDSFFSSLEALSSNWRVEGGFFLTLLKDQPKPRPADKQLTGAIFDALVTLRKLDIKVCLELGTPPSSLQKKSMSAAAAELPAEESPGVILRMVSLYMCGLVASMFTGYAPTGLTGLSQLMLLKQAGVEESLRRYSTIKSRLVVDAKMYAARPLTELIDSVSATLDEVLNLPPKLGPSALETSNLALPSKGASDRERIVVFQMNKDLTSEQKMRAFLLGFSGKGLYLRPLEDFGKRFELAYKKARSKGFIEFSLLVSAGVDYTAVVGCMKDAGALKREVVHYTEIGYSDINPGKTVRISEWYSLSGGRYQSAYSARVERVPSWMAIVGNKF